MSVLPDGKGIAFSSRPWLKILGTLGLFLIIVIISVPQFVYSPEQIEKARISAAFTWFSGRTRDPKVRMPDIFELKEFHEGKNGWIATLTRKPKPGQTGCSSKYGCYSVTFDSAAGKLTCSTQQCTDDLLP